MAYYKIINTTKRTEALTEMYGIEGACNGSVVTVSALSQNKAQIELLVNRLNESELDLETFKSTLAQQFKGIY